MELSLDDLVAGLECGILAPDRVVVDQSGYATSPGRALMDHGVTATVAFVRDDGWSLAAPAHLADVAHALWADKWYRTYLQLPIPLPLPGRN